MSCDLHTFLSVLVKNAGSVPLGNPPNLSPEGKNVTVREKTKRVGKVKAKISFQIEDRKEHGGQEM